MGELLRDVRFGFRTLLKRPGFSLVAILTLALGIGANSAIFSFIAKVFLDPLPYRDPERLVMVWQDYRQRGGPEREYFSWANFLDYRAETRTLADLAAYEDAMFIVTGDGEPEAVPAQFVSDSMFSVLGTPFALGRGFLPEEGRYGGPAAVVLGYDLWQRRYGGSPGVIGKSVFFDGKPHVVVGVLPADFYFPLAPSCQLFATKQEPPSMAGERGNISVRTVGRLAPGVSLQQARASLNGVAARIIHDNANADNNVRAAVYPLRSEILGPVQPALLVLLATVGFVLLIACANVANLQLARATTRRGEIGVRAALGANPARLVRQFLTEALLLSLAGGCLGLALGAGGVAVLRRLGASASFPLPRIEEVAVNGTVLGFTLLVAVLTGLLFGLAPALAIRRTDVSEVLKEGGGTASGRTSGRSTGRLLVVVEIALALVLVVGSGLMLRSLRKLSAIDTGYDSRGLLAFRLQAPVVRYPEDHQVAAFYSRVIEKLQGLPGVTSAAAVSTLPLAENGTAIVLMVQGGPAALPERLPVYWYRSTSPGYFKTAHMAILRGRGIEDRDRAGAPKVAVINQSAARQYFPGEDPLGKVLMSRHIEGFSYTVVGVVQNARTIALTSDEAPAIYLPLAQMPLRFMGIVVRTSGDPAALANPARAVIHQLDPNAATVYLKPLAASVDAAVGPARALGALMTGFGILALALAAVGIYGLMSYLANQRVREISIRMAIGADGGAIRRLVLVQALVLSAAGIGIGLLGALTLTRLLKGILFETGTLDPAAFLVSIAVLVTAALAAGYLPAWRASRLDPARVLRS
ncbi:MAG TPA: ABC transporter permease [Thermoanaerobaculia bacterium]